MVAVGTLRRPRGISPRDLSRDTRGPGIPELDPSREILVVEVDDFDGVVRE